MKKKRVRTQVREADWLDKILGFARNLSAIRIFKNMLRRRKKCS